MRIVKPVVLLTMGLATTLALTACGDQPAAKPVANPTAVATAAPGGTLQTGKEAGVTPVPAPSTSVNVNVHLVQPTGKPTPQQPTVAPTPTIPAEPTIPNGSGDLSQRRAAAAAVASYFNHFYNYPTTLYKQLDKVVPGGLVFSDTANSAEQRKYTAAQAKQMRAAMERIDPLFKLLYLPGKSDVEVVRTYLSTLYVGAYMTGANLSFKIDAAQVSVAGSKATVPGTALNVYRDGKLADSGRTTTSGAFQGSFTLTKVAGQWLISGGASK